MLLIGTLEPTWHENLEEEDDVSRPSRFGGYARYKRVLHRFLQANIAQQDSRTGGTVTIRYKFLFSDFHDFTRVCSGIKEGDIIPGQRPAATLVFFCSIGI